MIPIEIDGVTKTRVEHWCGELPGYAHHLRTWGEAGVVKLKTKTSVKLDNNGITCMMVGYALNHKPDVYRMWDEDTNRVHTTRDVIWLKRMFFAHTTYNPETATHVDESMEAGEDNGKEASNTLTDAKDADEKDEKIHVLIDREEPEEDGELQTSEGNNDADGEQLDDEPEEEPETKTRSGRVSRAPAYLKDFAVMALTKAEIEYYADLRSMATSEICGEDLAVDYEMAAVGAGLGDGFENTRELKVMKYKEAMKDGPVNWLPAVKEEHDRMVKHKVWKPVKKSEVPVRSKVLTST